LSRPIVIMSQIREVFFLSSVPCRIVSLRLIGARVVLAASRPLCVVTFFRYLLLNIIIVYRSFPAILSENIGRFKIKV